MKKNYFLRIGFVALTAIGLLTTSCTDDNNPNEGTDETANTGDTGFISLSMINSSVNSVTKAEGGLHYGTAGENKVNTVLIVLYDSDDPTTSTVQYSITLNDIGIAGTPGSDMVSITPAANSTTYTTVAQKVVRAEYKLAVFINPPAALAASSVTGVGASLQAITTAADVTVPQLTGSTKNNFLMSNFSGLITVEESDIYDSANAAESAPVPLYVERAVAKVSMTLGADINTTNLPATIGDIKWNVDVINKKTYWMRKPAFMLEQTSVLVGVVNDSITEKDPATGLSLPTNRVRMYATDPNWDDISIARNSSSGATLANEFIYSTSVNLTPTSSTDPVNEDDYAYVTENTMNSFDQYEDVTTSVLIAAVITPKTTYFGETLTSGAEYFLYNKMAFTREDIEDIWSVATDPDPSNVDIRSYNDTWGNFLAANPGGISNLPSILEDMKTDFSDYTLASSKDVTENGSTVRYFAPDAPNYYYVPIRHFSNDLQNVLMRYGRYGVVRNNWYNLTLKSINNYGYAEIPPDRPNPDDQENTWLSIQFEILNWIEREQEIDL